MPQKIELKGKRINLYFDSDVDGTISAVLVVLFSGAKIERLFPTRAGLAAPKKIPGVLNVFVDCRSCDRSEDVRIDHHASGETPEYLSREGIFLDTSYGSAMSLVADYLGVSIHSEIRQHLDALDSRKPNVFKDFTYDEQFYAKAFFGKRKFVPSDFNDFDVFREKLFGMLNPGFRIDQITDHSKYERELMVNYGVTFARESGRYLIVYSGEKQFEMRDKDFNDRVLPYILDKYYPIAEEQGTAVYIVGAFKTQLFEYAQDLTPVPTPHPEPFQLFVARSQNITKINVARLIDAAKAQTGIQNGGGRDAVGGLNTSYPEKAINALEFILSCIKKDG